MTDETRHSRHLPAVLSAAGALLALACVTALLVVVARRVDFSFGASDGVGATQVSIPLLFFGAIEGSFLYASMVAIAVESAELRLRLSRIFWPIFAVKVTLSLTVLLSAAQGFDLLAHHFRPYWNILYTPSLRVVQDSVLLGTFLSLTWLHVALLTGRGWGRGRLALLVATMFMLTLIVTLVAIEIAQRVA